MAERFPPLEPVRTRGAFASHAGPERSTDDQSVAYLQSDTAAFAILVRGMAPQRSGRPSADLVTDTCLRIFRESTASMLDDLAETWWRAEHVGTKVRPFSSLPIADRSELRARVKKLLLERTPDALGDQAVLEAETTRLLELPAAAFRRVNSEFLRRADRDRMARGTGASGVCAIFAAGRVSIAHIGDCRVARLRRGRYEALTIDHTLVNDYLKAMPDLTEEQRSELPRGVITRALGMQPEPQIDVVDVPLERRDTFFLMSPGLAGTFDERTIKEALVAHGVRAAEVLVERGQENFADHTLDNVAAVAVEIL